ncbi:MAG: hypothetical protein ACKV2Q_27500 [Planctomycetaceae bacterium]
MTSTDTTDSSSLPHSGWGMKCVFAVAALSLLCFCFGKVSDGYDALRLRKDNAAIQAVCTSRSSDNSSYEFSVANVKYHGLASADFQQGDLVDVLYLPSHPAVNRPANGLIMDIVVGGLIVAFFLAPIFFKIAGLKLIRRDDKSLDRTIRYPDAAPYRESPLGR